jgi:hypothetical protein
MFMASARRRPPRRSAREAAVYTDWGRTAKPALGGYSGRCRTAQKPAMHLRHGSPSACSRPARASDTDDARDIVVSSLAGQTIDQHWRVLARTMVFTGQRSITQGQSPRQSE